MTEPTVITEPGTYTEIDDATYHADPVPESSLSVSGAKRILDAPARFAWDRDHKVYKKAFDFGHAAHEKVLGRGPEIAIVPVDVLAKDGGLSTTAAKKFVADARARGAVPLKASDAAIIDDMAARLLEHDAARELLAEGVAELSLFWRDIETKVMLRARLDWLTAMPNSGRPVVVDYKTTARSCDPERWGWEAGDYGYHMQDCWYREGLSLAHDADDPAFLFIVQEKNPPYLVSVCELDEDAREVGAQRNRVARRVYLDCMTRGEWPGYPPHIHAVSIPRARYAPEPPEEIDQ
jgi:hypothetical protein